MMKQEWNEGEMDVRGRAMFEAARIIWHDPNEDVNGSRNIPTLMPDRALPQSFGDTCRKTTVCVAFLRPPSRLV
jgi:hypothetical protein